MLLCLFYLEMSSFTLNHFPKEGPGGWGSLLLYFTQAGDGMVHNKKHPVKENEIGETKHLFLSIFRSFQCLFEGLKGQEILK